MTGRDELRRLLAAGTKGPWRWEQGREDFAGTVFGGGASTVVSGENSEAIIDVADARLIVAAVNNLGPLLERLESLERVVAKVAAMPDPNDIPAVSVAGCPLCAASALADAEYNRIAIEHAPDCAWVDSVKLTGGG